MHIALFLTFLYSVYASQCGDGICDSNESCSSCPTDCYVSCVSNIAPLAYCYGCQANAVDYCFVYEVGSCVPPALMEYCGDGQCSGDEDCYSCNLDCGSCSVTEPVWEYCGDFICNNDETCSSCPNDCGSCLTNETEVVLGAESNLASNGVMENAPVVIGSVSAGLFAILVIGVGVGVAIYKAKAKKRAARAKEDAVSEEPIPANKEVENPILKTNTVYRNSVSLANPVRVPNSVHHKKSFAPQLAPRSVADMEPSSLTSTALKNSTTAFLEQYDFTSFHAMHARQQVRKVRRPIHSNGARLAEQINKLSV